MSYCTLCGNTGIDIDGNVCKCKALTETFYDSVSCLEIPDQYRGVMFNQLLVPKDLHKSYASYLQTLHDGITSMTWEKSVLLVSPIKHSKSVMAYSCLEHMFRMGVDVVPIFDLLEIKRILTDVDMCRKPIYELDEPERLVTNKYLFAKVPRVTPTEVFDVLTLLLDRRVRRNNCTVFMYDGTWSNLERSDKHGILTGLLGDGTYGTLALKSWGVTKSIDDIDVPDNIG